MSIRCLGLILSIFLASSCSSQSSNEDSCHLIRFDQVLYQYLRQQVSEDALLEHKAFLDLFGERVIGIGRSDSAGFFDRLRKYFSDPSLMNLYRDEQQIFADVATVEDELEAAFRRLRQDFPEWQYPAVYLHVSGLYQNVVVGDSILSLSADKYLGADYPLYARFFYDYQLAAMAPERLAPDMLLGFLMTNLPFQGRTDVLLDRMLYEGQLRYLLSQLLPRRKTHEYLAYNEKQHAWCHKYRKRIWKTILENHDLFQTNPVAVQQYLTDAPYTAALPVESPPRAGVWVGFQIISSYMQRHPTTSLSELMRQTDYAALLKDSGYKP